MRVSAGNHSPGSTKMLSCAVSYLLAVLCRHTLWLTFVSLSGTYSAAVGAIANSTCSTCPTYSNSPAGSAALTACFCNPGSTGNHVLWCGNSCTITLTCNLCDAGTYKVETGGAVCTNCLAGEYSPTVGATSDVCQTCPANSYSAQRSTGIDKCKCNVGYTSIDGENCEACAPGTYKSVTTTDDSRGPYGRWLMDGCPQDDQIVEDPLMAAAHEALGQVVCCTGILLLVYVCARVCMC